MKKIIYTVAITLALFLTGCTQQASAVTIYKEQPRFKQVYGQNLGGHKSVAIIVDNETGTMYLWTKCSNSGGLTIIVDEAGEPMLWED